MKATELWRRRPVKRIARTHHPLAAAPQSTHRATDPHTAHRTRQDYHDSRHFRSSFKLHTRAVSHSTRAHFRTLAILS